jgi:hypothetical protein
MNIGNAESAEVDRLPIALVRVTHLVPSVAAELAPGRVFVRTETGS